MFSTRFRGKFTSLSRSLSRITISKRTEVLSWVSRVNESLPSWRNWIGTISRIQLAACISSFCPMNNFLSPLFLFDVRHCFPFEIKKKKEKKVSREKSFSSSLPFSRGVAKEFRKDTKFNYRSLLAMNTTRNVLLITTKRAGKQRERPIKWQDWLSGNSISQNSARVINNFRRPNRSELTFERTTTRQLMIDRFDSRRTYILSLVNPELFFKPQITAILSRNFEMTPTVFVVREWLIMETWMQKRELKKRVKKKREKGEGKREEREKIERREYYWLVRKYRLYYRGNVNKRWRWRNVQRKRSA